MIQRSGIDASIRKINNIRSGRQYNKTAPPLKLQLPQRRKTIIVRHKSFQFSLRLTTFILCCRFDPPVGEEKSHRRS